MERAGNHEREPQQLASSAIDGDPGTLLHMVDVPDGYTMVSFQVDFNEMQPPCSKASLEPGSMASSASDPSLISAMLKQSETHRSPPSRLDCNISSPCVSPQRNVTAWYASLIRLRDERLLLQTKTDNLRNKYAASRTFLDNDIEELSDALSQSFHGIAFGGNVNGLKSRFVEDTNRYQRQLIAVRAAEAELNDIERRIIHCEAKLFEQLELHVEQMARDP